MKTSVKQNSAFTLIEMIGVLAIIGILAAVVAPRVIESIRDAKVTSAIASVNSAKSATLSYYQRYDRIPLDGDVTPIVNNRPGASAGSDAPPNEAAKSNTFGQILYYQELLIEELKAPVGEATASQKDFAIGCAKADGGTLSAGGGDATYGTNFFFKSAGNATRIAYYYLPNLTSQEAAALGTKVNGPFPVKVQGEESIIAESTIGEGSLANIEGANCWFTAEASDGTHDAYLYVAHQ